MKINPDKILGNVAIFVWSIFMGVTAISIGFGAAFPPMNLIAKPFVCLTGQMNYGELTSNPMPGTTYTQITWFCQNNLTGAKTELGMFPMTLYAGVIYGLLLFVVICIIRYIASRRNGMRQAAQSEEQVPQFYDSRASFNEDNIPTANTTPPAETALARMKNLKALRAANMISESEYEQKRSEILKDV